jgi:hypothetical protein
VAHQAAVPLPTPLAGVAYLVTGTASLAMLLVAW